MRAARSISLVALVAQSAAQLETPLPEPSSSPTNIITYQHNVFTELLLRGREPWDTVPVQNATVCNSSSPVQNATVGRQLEELLPTLSESFPHKVNVTLPSGRYIGFLLWLPRGFWASTEPWPTVWFLHGQGEAEIPTGVERNRTLIETQTRESSIAAVAHHGLPHRIAERYPLNERIVLIAPLCPRNLTLPEDDDTGRWHYSLPIVEALRVALLAATPKLDPERQVLTGLSLGGTGTWAWAGFNPSGVQPWAGVAPMSGMWPYHEEDSRNRAIGPIDASAIRALARTSLYVGHCADDAIAIIDLGTRVGLRCASERTLTQAGEVCGYAGDAIVEALRAAGNRRVTYKRFTHCPTPRTISDTDPLAGAWINPTQDGHDSWTTIYRSKDFLEWVLSVRRSGPPEPPAESIPADLLPERTASAQVRPAAEPNEAELSSLTQNIMLSKAVVALALLEKVEAFQAPAIKASTKAVGATMFSEGDIGVLPPLGVYDPLGLIEKRDMRRYEIMEIKHGRAAMLGFLHVIHIESGVRFPGYISGSAELKFTDVPAGLIASLEAIPKLGWLQVLAVALACETGYAGRAFSVVRQEPDREVGDIGGSGWVRYDDPEVKAYKLNVERQNGRAAMLGITGCLIHELLGVDALYPTGGFDGASPDPIIDGATSFANFPSFI